ncbi:ATP-grasp domain-containing protein [Candidatus Palauibacter sp.]|uniref:ATP-grasp domain-containing protein n=1 Tax=Candidatus Palauibacter sp. TaxID=3101350 RepID=UPI003AF1E514
MTAAAPEVTRRIGLSLGADLCWPIAYRKILERLDLRIPAADGTVRFQVEDVTIEPFDLQKRVGYDLVIDRLTHWYFPTREWIKKSVIMDDLYVFNNPWSVQSMEKHSTYCAMMKLGLPVPRTWLLPPKSYEPRDDLAVTLRRYARLFDLADVARDLGYPLFMKPYDGGGWRGVSRIEDDDSLRAAYDGSGKFVMHLQQGVEAHDRFVRCVGLGPQTRAVLYDPGAPSHDRYTVERDFVDAGDARTIRDTTLTINAFFGWDFNSCEVLRSGGQWVPIDFANPCPDSQVTSLHYHFPWLIKANIRWSIFCAATRRKMRVNLDWQPFFDACRPGMTPEEKIRACGAIAEARFETDRFVEFCDAHLADLDQVADDFFGSQAAREAVHAKVASLYPDPEIEEFTHLFFDRIQAARRQEPPGSVPILAS